MGRIEGICGPGSRAFGGRLTEVESGRGPGCRGAGDVGECLLWVELVAHPGAGRELDLECRNGCASTGKPLWGVRGLSRLRRVEG